MSERDWEAEFQDHLRRERDAHGKRIAAMLRIHRDKNDEALEASGGVFDRYDRAKENLDEFILEYGQYLRTRKAKAGRGVSA